MDNDVVDHLGYAFMEVANHLPGNMTRDLARALGLTSTQIQDIEEE